MNTTKCWSTNFPTFSKGTKFFIVSIANFADVCFFGAWDSYTRRRILEITYYKMTKDKK
jgi:hypothetical protein